MQTKTKTKTKKWVKFRHKVIITLVAPFILFWAKQKYHIKVVRSKELRKRQCVVLMNHQTGFDQFFVSLAMYPRHAYFVASEDIFSLGFLSRLLRWAVAPIPIKKQTTDVQAVMNCIRVARQGGTIALAPEGNRTFSGLPCYSNPAIAPLVKKLGLPLALFRIEGGYGIQPRWSDVCRKGKMQAYVHKIIEPEDYKDLSNEELHQLIEKELYVDETQNPGPFTHQNLAEYLERAMYVCPDCGLSEFHSQGDLVTCKTCGKQIRYLPDNRIQGVNCEFPFPYVAQWYRYQNDYVNQLDTNAYLEKPLYRDTASVFEVEPYKKKNLLEENAPVVLYGNRLQLGKKTLFFDDIRVITILGKNKVNVYHTDGLFQIKGDARFNGLKYMNIFYRYKNQLAGEGDFLGI